MRTSFDRLGVSVRSLNLTRAASAIFGLYSLGQILSEIQPDIIHTQGIRADLLCSQLNRYPVRISTQRNNPFVDYRLQYGRFTGFLLAHLHLAAFKRIPNVVACSEYLAKNNSLHGLRTDVIRNGIDLHRGQKLLEESERIELRKKLDLPLSGQIFLLVGPLLERKAPDVVVAAFKKRRSDNNSHLCVIGDGPFLKKCKILAHGTRNIRFVGHIDTIDPYFAAANGYISASLSEGLPNSAMEALSWGLPVFLSDIDAHREILLLNSKAGYLFKSNSPDDLIRLLEWPINVQEVNNAALDIAHNHLRSTIMANHYQRLYLSSVESIST